ncbi:MAG: hypothetical protein ABID83_03160 [Candidatus Omnitrophota bacterium]
MNKLINLTGVVLFILATFVSSAIAAEEPFKIKGFYVGMEIGAARDRLAELLNDQEIMVEENAEEDEGLTYISNLNKITKEELSQIPALASPGHADKIWESLIKVGYINKNGTTQKKFWRLKNPSEMESVSAAIDMTLGKTEPSRLDTSIYTLLKAASALPPPAYYRILADDDKRVKSIFFSGPLVDKLFNTEGADPRVFRENFVGAYVKYLAEPGGSVYSPNYISSDKVVSILDCPKARGCKITLFSDKSLSIEKVAEEKDFKFD